jgi:hypothetical protein
MKWEDYLPELCRRKLEEAMAAVREVALRAVRARSAMDIMTVKVRRQK